MLENTTRLTLGEFQLTTPTMRVSDPCYDRDVWCCGTLTDCRTGTWEAAIYRGPVDDLGEYVHAILIRHVEAQVSLDEIERAMCAETDGWEAAGFEVGVDSGQAGFYDEAHFQDNSVFSGKRPPAQMFGDLWYSHCCSLTLSQLGAGVIPYGVVSSSGFGDWSYFCNFHRDDHGNVDAAFIVFIDDEEGDGDDEC